MISQYFSKVNTQRSFSFWLRPQLQIQLHSVLVYCLLDTCYTLDNSCTPTFSYTLQLSGYPLQTLKLQHQLSSKHFLLRDKLHVYIICVLGHTRPQHGIMCLSLSQSTPQVAWTQVEISGDSQQRFDEFPTPRDNFMVQISYKFVQGSQKINNNETSWTNASTLGIDYADKSLQTPTHCLAWGKWGLTMIGALMERVGRGKEN